MRPIEEASGAWAGWSVQYNRKIHERLALRIEGGRIRGTGDDADGEFELDGEFNPEGRISLVRRYTMSTVGSDAVGVPFLYEGQWTGDQVTGEWRPAAGPYDGGTFEMWPVDAEGRLE